MRVGQIKNNANSAVLSKVHQFFLNQFFLNKPSLDSCRPLVNFQSY